MNRCLLIFHLLFFPVFLSIAQKTYELKPVTVSSERKVDTVFGTWKFSVADYEFYEDKLILLTYTKNLEHAKIMLADGAQKVLSSVDLPDEAKELYKDYQGFNNVICKKHIYRILIRDNEIRLGSLPVDEYRRFIMPCLDTVDHNIFFSNYNRDYPEFTYYAYNAADSTLNSIRTVCDQEQLRGYNMELYFLKNKDRRQARILSDQYGIDIHRVAAAMSGLTSSKFYSPLYAPFSVLDDTIYIFDHYSDAIFTYGKDLKAIDSVRIDYHHPKNWREWKHKVIIDEEQKQAYAVYQKGGYYYLKNIDLKTGKIRRSFKLYNQYVSNLKVKKGYVYYVYSPFESLQEFFLYKELITN
jgi:hypothetical protein